MISKYALLVIVILLAMVSCTYSDTQCKYYGTTKICAKDWEKGIPNTVTITLPCAYYGPVDHLKGKEYGRFPNLYITNNLSIYHVFPRKLLVENANGKNICLLNSQQDKYWIALPRICEQMHPSCYLPRNWADYIDHMDYFSPEGAEIPCICKEEFMN